MTEAEIISHCNSVWAKHDEEEKRRLDWIMGRSPPPTDPIDEMEFWANRIRCLHITPGSNVSISQRTDRGSIFCGLYFARCSLPAESKGFCKKHMDRSAYIKKKRYPPTEYDVRTARRKAL